MHPHHEGVKTRGHPVAKKSGKPETIHILESIARKVRRRSSGWQEPPSRTHSLKNSAVRYPPMVASRKAARYAPGQSAPKSSRRSTGKPVSAGIRTARRELGLRLAFPSTTKTLDVWRRATLSDLLHGKAALTPEMALRIEKAFGPDMDHLLRMQLAYDVAKTREHARDISVKRYVPA
jgi:addiction module HigA family antidote